MIKHNNGQKQQNRVYGAAKRISTTNCTRYNDSSMLKMIKDKYNILQAVKDQGINLICKW